jgi:hypothetical protein
MIRAEADPRPPMKATSKTERTAEIILIDSDVSGWEFFSVTEHRKERNRVRWNYGQKSI